MLAKDWASIAGIEAFWIGFGVNVRHAFTLDGLGAGDDQVHVARPNVYPIAAAALAQYGEWPMCRPDIATMWVGRADLKSVP